jgi:lysophospholipase L1-like esterase
MLMQIDLAKLLVAMLALLGSAPPDMPQKLQIAAGDRIVAIGDSITQAGGYLHMVDQVLASQYSELKIPPIVNAGIGGQKAEDLVKRFQKDVIDRKPAVVALSIGINDVWHRVKEPHDDKVLADYKANVAKMVQMAQDAGIKVILLTPTVIEEDPASEGNRRLKMYVDAEKQIAASQHCTLVNLHQMFLDALAKKPKDADEKWLTSDGVHMKPAGDALMAIGVLRGLGVPDAKIKAPETRPAAKP